MVVPGMAYMPYMNSVSLYPYISKMPEQWLQPDPYYSTKDIYQQIFLSQQLYGGSVKRRRKYRIIPNYHFVYF